MNKKYIKIPMEDAPYIVDAMLYQISTYNVSKEGLTDKAIHQQWRLKQIFKGCRGMEELCRESVYYDVVQDTLKEETK